MIHVVDLYPTLLSQAGASLDQPLPLDGTDMWNTIISNYDSPRQEVVHALPVRHIDTGPMSIRCFHLPSGNWQVGFLFPSQLSKAIEEHALLVCRFFHEMIDTKQIAFVKVSLFA